MVHTELIRRLQMTKKVNAVARPPRQLIVKSRFLMKSKNGGIPISDPLTKSREGGEKVL